MRYKDRRDAAARLAKELDAWRSAPDAIVIALPRGGVVLGRVIADALGLPLDIVVTRKIGAPENEEYAVGAITEKGDAVWNERERAAIPADYLERAVAAERKEAERRLKTYRRDLPSRDLSGKTVIVVDDGIATGLTMRAALATVKAEGARKIVVAVPVCAPDVMKDIAREADQVVALQTPGILSAIGNFYKEFLQVDDDTVMRLLRRN